MAVHYESKASPVLDAGNIYAAGDGVGTGFLSFDLSVDRGVERGQWEIQQLEILDVEEQDSDLEIFFFKDNTALATVVSNNDALDIDDDDIKNYLIGHVSVAAADYSTLETGIGRAIKTGLDIRFQLPLNNKVKALIKVGGAATPTWAAADSLQLKIIAAKAA